MQNHLMRFFLFQGCFREGRPCQARTTRTLWRALLLFDRAHFVDKLGLDAGSIANSTETAVKLKKNFAWCEILKKSPCNRTRTKNLRKWSEIFSRFQTHISAERKVFFLAKNLALAVEFFRLPPAVGCLRSCSKGLQPQQWDSWTCKVAT